MLAGDGSDRRFYRLPARDHSLVLLHHPHPPGAPVTENDSYFFIGRHLRRCRVSVPEIHRYCRSEGWFLLEDLGDLSLQEVVTAGATPERRREYYFQALELLVRLQIDASPAFSPRWCFDTPRYDANLVRQRECQYFVRAFLQGFVGLEVNDADLAAEFEVLIARALASGEPTLVHRDFQSRNLMVRSDGLYLIDFQGARLGPRYYDVAALLIDPYVDLSPEAQETFLQAYRDLLPARMPLESGWRETYASLALCRNLQILGAYGFLSRVKGKTGFIPYIAPALRGLHRRLQEENGRTLPRLGQVVRQAWEKLRQWGLC